MQPRGRLDISLRELLAAALPPRKDDPDALVREIGGLWGDADRTLVALSVRSAFDAALTALDWPAGSAVLMSAINIADMGRIVLAHGLDLIPVDVDPETLAPDPKAIVDLIERNQSTTGVPPIRALCITHLFGSRIDLTPFAAIASRYGLSLWEDAAQAWAVETATVRGDRLLDTGDPAVDLSLTSFGLIKTHTALGGGLARFRDRAWCALAQSITTDWPRQAESDFFRRSVVRGLALSLLTRPLPFSLVANLELRLGRNLDDLLSGATRGFAAGDLLERIRRQPSRRLTTLLRDRLSHPDPRGAVRRAVISERYRRELPTEVLVGRRAAFPTTWVFPIRVTAPDVLQTALARAGFDATQRASRLVQLASLLDRPLAPADWLGDLLYLPLHPELRPAHIAAIAVIVRQHVAAFPLRAR